MRWVFTSIIGICALLIIVIEYGVRKRLKVCMNGRDTGYPYLDTILAQIESSGWPKGEYGISGGKFKTVCFEALHETMEFFRLQSIVYDPYLFYISIGLAPMIINEHLVEPAQIFMLFEMIGFAVYGLVSITNIEAQLLLRANVFSGMLDIGEASDTEYYQALCNRETYIERLSGNYALFTRNWERAVSVHVLCILIGCCAAIFL